MVEVVEITLGKRLRALCESSRQTQGQVGTAVGKPCKVVWIWENVINAPRMGMVEKMTQHFSVSKSYLFDEDELPSAPLPYNVRPIFALRHQTIPMIRAVACGKPIYSPEELDVYMDSLVDTDAVFTIRGDSMMPIY